MGQRLAARIRVGIQAGFKAGSRQDKVDIQSMLATGKAGRNKERSVVFAGVEQDFALR